MAIEDAWTAVAALRMADDVAADKDTRLALHDAILEQVAPSTPAQWTEGAEVFVAILRAADRGFGVSG